MTTNNMTTTIDFGAIFSAALVTAVQQATAVLSARVDELERLTATQGDEITALLQGLRRVERLADDSAMAGAIAEAVEDAIGSAFEEHCREHDHLDENDVERLIGDAIEQHASEAGHMAEDDVADAVQSTLRDCTMRVVID